MSTDPRPAELAGETPPPSASNPYASQTSQPPAAFAETATPYQPPPRVWTVFVTIFVALVTVIAVPTAAVIGIIAWYFATGGNAGDLQKDLLDIVARPDIFIGLGLLSQLTIAATAVAAARMSPVPFAQRLGFLTPTMPAWKLLIVLLGSLVPFAGGMAIAVWLAEFIEPDPTVAKLYESMTLGWAIPFLLFISLAPGFTEEMLFRGYAQRRLIDRWGPFVGILLTSGIFAAFHIAPHTVVFAFPVGIWLGLMAWKSGSIWPGIVCHAAINGLWNIWQLGQQFKYFSEEPPLALLISFGAIGVITFLASLWILFASPTGAPASPAPQAP